MELIRTLEQLFRDQAPETLMAFFGALTSMGLFYLIWVLLRQLFGLQRRNADWEATQERATTAVVEALVGALVTEAGHLRATLDGILEESSRRSEQNAQILSALSTQAEEAPVRTLELLRPEFDHLRRALRQTEARIIAKIALQAGEPGGSEAETDPERKPETEA
jgi:hypothetical protein